MNANELADEIERIYNEDIADGILPHLEQAATMLRQQQTEIEVLKADNDKLTEALLKANRVYDFDNPLLDKEALK